jgi:uncharacterized protein (TIGR02246 family)
MIDSIGFHDQITTLITKLVRSYDRRDPASCAECFTHDATLLLPGFPTAKGREEIAATMKSIMDAGHGLHRMRIQEADFGEKFGYAIVNLMSTRGEGQVLLALRHDNGKWLIHSEAVVRD